MLKISLAFLCVGMMAGPSEALTLVGSGTGVVQGSAIDNLGRFRPAGTDLAGLPVTMTIVIDLLGAPVMPLSDGNGSVIRSGTGSFSGPQADIGGGTISVGGPSSSIDGTNNTAWAWSSCFTNPAGICNSLSTSQGGSPFNGTNTSQIVLQATNYLRDAPGGIFDIPAGNVCDRVEICAARFSLTDGGGAEIRTSGEISLSSLTFTVLDVPEPATWLTMIVGFFAIGSTLRARSKAHLYLQRQR